MGRGHGLITPNTFFYTETARQLRCAFAQKKSIIQITNYGDIQLFENATTYSAITVFSNNPQHRFKFQKAVICKEFEEREFDMQSLHQNVWNLNFDNEKKLSGRRLGEIANIHVGITTLCDRAYIFKVLSEEGNFVVVDTKLKGILKLEKGILKPIVKGSTLKESKQTIVEVVLFPYTRINGRNQIISEQQLMSSYPLAYQYLLSVRDELDKRDNGQPNAVAWYAFGRSQGLDTSFGRKIIFSPMNARPNFILYENEDCTLYSGYCIKYKGDEEKLLEQLNSDRMFRYIEASSRDFRGGWKAYNKKVVENFVIENI